jgi:hypothetical protein
MSITGSSSRDAWKTSRSSSACASSPWSVGGPRAGEIGGGTRCSPRRACRRRQRRRHLCNAGREASWEGRSNGRGADRHARLRADGDPHHERAARPRRVRERLSRGPAAGDALTGSCWLAGPQTRTAPRTAPRTTHRPAVALQIVTRRRSRCRCDNRRCGDRHGRPATAKRGHSVYRAAQTG